MKNKLLRSGRLLGLAAIFVAVFTVSASGGEDKSVCVIVSVERSAWIYQKDSQVKSTLKVGDILNEGDRVLVMRGNKVQVCFDKQGQNIVEVEGDALFYLSSSVPAKIELVKGTMFAVLDHLPTGSEFSIQTLSAIAAVQGTRYQVTSLNDQSSIMTYHGHVTVSGRDLNGEISGESVVVSTGKKTSISKPGEHPAPVIDMTDSEKNQINGILEDVDKTRRSIDSEQVDLWLAQASKTARVKENSPGESDSSKTNTAAVPGKGWVII